MKTAHGVHVDIKAKGKLVRDFKNPYEKRYPDFSGEFNSRLITVTPDTPFEVAVTFVEKFQKFSETGVLITIGWGSHCQSFWLHYEHVKLFDKHTFSVSAVWSSDRDDAVHREVHMHMPDVHPPANATADWIEADVYYPNAGCIAIWVERGNLKGFRDGLESYEWAPEDPPKNTRYIPSKAPKVVRSEWFHWLKSDNGLPHVFEFRNMNSGDVRRTSRSAKTALDHLDDAMASDDETASSDPSLSDNDWRSSNNDSHPEDDDGEQYEYRGSKEARPKRKRAPGLSDAAPSAKAPRRSIVSNTNSTVRVLATPASRIVSLPVGRKMRNLLPNPPNKKTDSIQDISGRDAPQPEPGTGLATKSSRARNDPASKHSDENGPVLTTPIKSEPTVKKEGESSDRSAKGRGGTSNFRQRGNTVMEVINLISDDEEDAQDEPTSSLAFQPLLPDHEDFQMQGSDSAVVGRMILGSSGVGRNVPDGTVDGERHPTDISDDGQDTADLELQLKDIRIQREEIRIERALRARKQQQKKKGKGRL